MTNRKLSRIKLRNVWPPCNTELYCMLILKSHCVMHVARLQYFIFSIGRSLSSIYVESFPGIIDLSVNLRFGNFLQNALNGRKPTSLKIMPCNKNYKLHSYNLYFRILCLLSKLQIEILNFHLKFRFHSDIEYESCAHIH